MRPGCALVALIVTAVAGSASAGAGPKTQLTAGATCRQAKAEPGYAARVDRALRAGRDVWGEALLAAPGGPTYEGVRRQLSPLLLARAAKGAPLTRTHVYYVPFALPVGNGGATSVALHVADGSEILSHRADGERLTVSVGAAGGERYGACLTRLSEPLLAAGYLPVLETAYTDSMGVTYRQESFAGRLPELSSLVSFVRLTADARRSRGNGARLLFTPSTAQASLAYDVGPRGRRAVYVAWIHGPRPRRLMAIDRGRYEAAREAMTAYWERRLAEGATIAVPEGRVRDAQRAVLIQNLALTWRYSIGNAYQQFSFPEGVDVAQVMSTYGFDGVARAILRTSLTRKPNPYPNWKIGQKLVGAALYYRLFRDRDFVHEATPVLRGYVAELGRQIDAGRSGMLQRERYSSDIPDSVYGLHSQAVAWQGLRWMAAVWAETGEARLASRSRNLAARLESGLRTAVRASQRSLPDGSLFIPVRLLDPEPAYDALTASRSGSYWNLVMPYALASGLFAPGSPEAEGVLRYMLLHGSRLLGLVRAGAYALYGLSPPYPASGTDQVYGLNVARFLADNDEADQLVLSLYGQLGAAMTPGTFVAGEAASVSPLEGKPHRSMYLPPNGAANASFLEALRLTLVHETVGRDGGPRGLELAYATPRTWLRPGSQTVVRDAPTSFGRLAFSIRSGRTDVHVSVDVPGRSRLGALGLRLRLPRGDRITGATLAGRPFHRFEAVTETFDLPTRPGRLELVVQVERR